MLVTPDTLPFPEATVQGVEMTIALSRYEHCVMKLRIIYLIPP